MTTTCIIAWVAVLILLPVIILLNITSTRQQRARRLRARGWSQQRIAAQLGVSRSTIRRDLGLLAA